MALVLDHSSCATGAFQAGECVQDQCFAIQIERISPSLLAYERFPCFIEGGKLGLAVRNPS